MPPGNDALATYFKGSAARRLKDPRLSESLEVQRAMADCLHVLASEPLEVMYAEEPELTFYGPSLWFIPLSARNSPNVILYFHGGGYVTNDVSSHRKMTGHIAKAANMQLLSINYRMAPEHKFPAWIDDAVESFEWLLKKGYKPENIVTMGDSAGGGLCTSVALKLRDMGRPLPGAIVPISPWYDMECKEGTIETNKETDALINQETITGLVSVIAKPEDKNNPLLEVKNADPKGLPPMYIVVGGYETLADHGTNFAEKAKKAGVEVELEIGEGQQHVYTFM